jgi:hypothetical protein
MHKIQWISDPAKVKKLIKTLRFFRETGVNEVQIMALTEIGKKEIGIRAVLAEPLWDKDVEGTNQSLQSLNLGCRKTNNARHVPSFLPDL